jgi:predicted nucleic acid-binding Zn ribbon protein
MERAGEILGRVLRRLERPEAALAWLSSAWPSIVGQSLAMHARPVRCTAGCLELIADGVAWQQQLQTMTHELCGRINRAWGASLVREVKFVPDRPAVNRPPREADNEHTPFIRRRRG